MPIASPYLTTAEAAEVLRFTGKHACNTFLRYAKRKGITFFYRGKTVLVLKSDVLDSLKKHGPRRQGRSQTTVAKDAHAVTVQ